MYGSGAAKANSAATTAAAGSSRAASWGSAALLLGILARRRLALDQHGRQAVQGGAGPIAGLTQGSSQRLAASPIG